MAKGLTQIALLPDLEEYTAPQLKTIEVGRVPSMATLIRHVWGRPRGGWGVLTDDQFVLVWKWAMVADYLYRQLIKPLGYVHSRHFHILPQVVNVDYQDEIKAEFYRRGLEKKVELVVGIPVSMRGKSGKEINAILDAREEVYV